MGNPAINFMNARGTQQADGSFRVKLLDGYEASFVLKEKVDIGAWYGMAEKDIAAFQAKVRPAEKTNKDVPFKYPVATVTDAAEEKRAMDKEDWVIGARPEFIRITDQYAFHLPEPGEMSRAKPSIFDAMPPLTRSFFYFFRAAKKNECRLSDSKDC